MRDPERIIRAPSATAPDSTVGYGNVDARTSVMCHIFSNIDPKRYAYDTRSVRLSGHVTSIRLEAAFWQILEEIAASQDVSVGRLLTRLHDEVLDFEGEPNNFTSLLRCACLTYVADVRGHAAAASELQREARRDFALVGKSSSPPAA
jgi:predicted DNA-binding ribbon-helix-helix protein